MQPQYMSGQLLYTTTCLMRNYLSTKYKAFRALYFIYIYKKKLNFI